MKKIAFLFPGQGSQKVGMGRDLFEEYTEVKEIFEMASDTVKMDLAGLCFSGPMETLTETVNLQPAITAVNLSFLAALQKEGIIAAFTAGHSLGEYSALAAANAISFEDTIRLVFRRGELMHRESRIFEGAMHAVIGLEISAVEAIVAEERKNGVVAVANHNTKTQIVITGAPGAVSGASEKAKAMGARTVPLRVSGAWHSELIAGSVEEFTRFLSEIPFKSPEIPVIFNVTADTAETPEEIRSIMAEQLCRPVRWYDTMCRLAEEEVEGFIEVGPGNVLTGLAKKILPEALQTELHSVNNMKGLEKCLKALT